MWISTQRTLAATALWLGVAGAAQATTLSVSVTNVSGVGGFSVTPVLAMFQDGSFDPFDAGGAASASLEALAELGDVSGVQADLAAAGIGAASAVIAAAGNGVPPIEPGETGTVEVTLDPGTQRFFSFLSMLLPSNDTFLGNDDATTFELFDAAGAYLGDRTINVTGRFIYDAGTEANDPSLGPAFVVGQDATLGGPDTGIIGPGQSFAAFDGVTTAPGAVLDGTLLDFLSQPGDFPLLQIQITQVAPIPLPAAAPVFALSLAVLGAGAWRRRRRMV